MKISTIIFLLVSFAFISCSGLMNSTNNTATVTTSASYKSLSLRDVNIYAFVDQKNIILQKSEELITKDLGEGVPEDVYYSFVKEQLAKGVSKYSFSKKVSFQPCISDSSLKTIEFILKNERHHNIKVPIDSLTVPGNPNGFSIVIDSLRAFITTSSIGYSQGPVTFYPSVIRHEGKFYVWDNANKKTVSFGLAVGEKNINGKLSKDEWKSSFISMVREILRSTPFYNWKGSE
jgi:hypothetical protein